MLLAVASVKVSRWIGLPTLLLYLAFGVVLSFAYERTGNLAVPVCAHALFNLNTIVMLLSGLPQ